MPASSSPGSEPATTRRGTVMSTRWKTLGISLTTAALLAAGCMSSKGTSGAAPPSGSDTSSSSTGSSAPAAAAPDSSPAATLRATLTGLLNDHVWLAGNALDTAVHAGGD